MLVKIMKQEATGTGKRWGILGLTYLAMLAYAIPYYAPAPVLPLIIEELKLWHAQAGLLMGLFALPGIAVCIPAGMLADRYGVKPVAVLSALVIALGSVIVALGYSFPVIVIGRILTGAGALTMSVVATKSVAQWFVRHELGIAMGIFNTGVPAGIILAFNGLGALGYTFGWHTSVWVSASVPVITLVGFLAVYSPPPSNPEGRDTKTTGLFLQLKGAGLPIWLVGLAWLWFNAASVSLLTFGTDYFISRNFSPAVAALLGSCYAAGYLVMSPVVGYLQHRGVAKEALLAIGGLGLAALVFAVPRVPSGAILLMLAAGIIGSFIPVPVFSLPTDMLKPEKLGMGFGIVSTSSILGALVGPYVVGLARDITGSYQAGFPLISVFALLCAATAIPIRILRGRAKRA